MAKEHQIDNRVHTILKQMGLTRALMDSMKDQSAEFLKRSSDERDASAFGWIGFAFAVSEWWYQLVTPEPNFWFGSFLLLTAILGFTVATLKYVGPRKKKIIILISAIALFCACDYWWHIQRKTKEAELKAQTEASQRKDTYQFLTSFMSYEQGDDPLRSTFSYINGGNTDIIVTNVCAHTTDLILGQAAGLQNGHICMFSEGETHLIHAGGDGQSRPFLSGAIGGRMSCADLTMFIDYNLVNQPGVQQEKQFRFVSRWSANGLRWLREEVNSPKRYCYDKLFQSPYGNSF